MNTNQNNVYKNMVEKWKKNVNSRKINVTSGQKRNMRSVLTQKLRNQLGPSRSNTLPVYGQMPRPYWEIEAEQKARNVKKIANRFTPSSRPKTRKNRKMNQRR